MNPFDWLTEDERRELPNDAVERLRRARAALEAAWMRSIPGRECWCIQQTVMHVRHRLSVLDPSRFAEADLAALEAWDAELDLLESSTGASQGLFVELL